MDDTSQKIIDATMALIRDKGYVATTTKDIAHLAGVNECTLFRKFKNKKDIVLSGIAQEKWRANITPELFQNVVWELQPDLEMFMTAYMDRITPDFVNLSIGLRAPQLYDETAPMIDPGTAADADPKAHPEPDHPFLPLLCTLRDAGGHDLPVHSHRHLQPGLGDGRFPGRPGTGLPRRRAVRGCLRRLRSGVSSGAISLTACSLN